MKIIVVKDYDAVSRETFAVMKKVVTNKKDVALGLATGSSPIELYKNMIQDYRDNETNYAQCQSFGLDEYVGINRNHPEPYWTFIHKSLSRGTDLPEGKIHVPYGGAKEDCEGYEKIMKNVSVDIQALGIGGNGHIGFSESGIPSTEGTHIAGLTEKTRSNNTRFFDNDINQVPIHVITMGTAAIMKTKKILLVVPGANKTDAVAAMVNGPVDLACPASVLQNHASVVIVVDEAAVTELAK